MITIEEAKQLCVEAHKGQWRKPKVRKNNILHAGELAMLNNNERLYIDKGVNRIYKGATKFIKIAEPYYTHPFAVADMMNTDDEKIVAYLHDVIEDTEADLRIFHDKYYITFNNSKFELTMNQWISLNILTKESYQKYEKYIQLIAEDKLATKVKIADMFHNMSCNPTKKAKKKYLSAIKILLKEI